MRELQPGPLCSKCIIGFVLYFASVTFGQYEWEIVSADPGATIVIDGQEDTLLQGPPWDNDDQDNCGTGGAADARCEWITERAGSDIHLHRNGVIAAILDGSMANQDVVVRDAAYWSDQLSTGTTWRVNYNAHFIAVDPADMPNLRSIMEFQYSGVTYLNLTLFGLASNGQYQFRVPPQHSWFDSPETGDFWKIKLTLRRLTPGMPAMVWIDNIDLVEAGETLYHEGFAIFGDADNDSDLDLNDYTAFPSCMLGEGVDYPSPSCHTFDMEGDDDVDMRDLSRSRRPSPAPYDHRRASLEPWTR